MLKLLICILMLSSFLSAEKSRSDHVCGCQSGINYDYLLEEEINHYWIEIQRMEESPDLHRMLQILQEFRFISEERLQMRMDENRLLDIIFDKMFWHRIPISVKDYESLIKIINNKSFEDGDISEMGIRVPIGTAISLCGLYISFLPGDRMNKLNGKTIFYYGLSFMKIKD